LPAWVTSNPISETRKIDSPGLGDRYALPTRSSDCRPCCLQRKLQRCCSGHCWRRDKSPCIGSTDGKLLPKVREVGASAPALLRGHRRRREKRFDCVLTSAHSVLAGQSVSDTTGYGSGTNSGSRVHLFVTTSRRSARPSTSTSPGSRKPPTSRTRSGKSREYVDQHGPRSHQEVSVSDAA
jgi:hypothetical protein